MIDTNRLKEQLRKWLQAAGNAAGQYPKENYHKGLVDAFNDAISLIDALEREYQILNEKDHICTCHTIRCDECIIRDG